MLGKRCRTLHRTASISQNMGPHYHVHHHNYHQAHDLPSARANPVVISHPNPPAVNPQVPAIIPQIIGFNPMITSESGAGGDQSPQSKLAWLPTPAPNSDSPPLPNNMPAWRHPHGIYDDDPKYSSRAAGAPSSTKRPQFTPRSALQTLLAAARQIACTDQSSGKSATSIEASKSPFKANSITSPSCANNDTISTAAKQGSLIWQGLTLSEATSKELPSNKQSTTPKASMLITHTQGASHEYSQNVSMNEAPDDQYQDIVQMNEVDSENIFDVEGTSIMGAAGHQIGLESAQDHHALYLATSPLAAEFTPNSGASMSFLESCYLCKRFLGQGRDIFMYRGEKAFCSVECRDTQMRLEERKEKLRYVHSQINKLNVRKQDILCANAGMGSSNTTSYYQPHNHRHHHQQYSSQAVAYNDKQHRTSLLMPAA